MKRVITRVINLISTAIILIAVAVLVGVVMTPTGETPTIFGYCLLRVMSGSMEPAIPINSLIIVKEEEASEIREGDIISFYSRDPALDGMINTHRVTAIESENGSFRFYTRGDANNAADPYIVYEEDLVGRLAWQSHTLGKVVGIFSNPIIFIPLILIPLAILLICYIVRTVRLARQIAREEEEAAVREAVNRLLEERRKKDSSNDT